MDKVNSTMLSVGCFMWFLTFTVYGTKWAIKSVRSVKEEVTTVKNHKKSGVE